MSMNDPLGDMLTRIRNGQMARKGTIICPWSKLRAHVCDVLQEEGFIRGYTLTDIGGGRQEMRIELKYDSGQPVIRELKRISKPGRRIYSKIADLAPVHNGLGLSVLSTPQGVMADYKARAQKVGGEVLCQVF